MVPATPMRMTWTPCTSEVHGCTAALSFQIGYQFGVLCLGMLKLPLGPCVFTVLDFHKVDVSIPGRNQGGVGCIIKRRRASSARSDQDEVWARTR